MALLSLAELLNHLGIASPISSIDTAKYTALLAGADAAVKAWCKWGIEQVTGQIDYYSGNGHHEFALRNPYVTAVTDLRVDQTGAWGQKASSFGSTTVKVAGTDYALKLDESTTRARGAVLVKLTVNNPLWFPSDLVFSRGRSGLSYSLPAAWPAGDGNIKVTYTYGFAPGSIPADIQLAVATLVGTVRDTVLHGGFLNSEGLGDYNYSQSMAKELELGSAKQLLSRYRLAILAPNP